MIKFTEMENRIKRIEAIENEAREVLKENGQPDREIKNHMEAQQILNEKEKAKSNKNLQINEEKGTWHVKFIDFIYFADCVFSGARRGFAMQVVYTIGYVLSFLRPSILQTVSGSFRVIYSLSSSDFYI